MEAMFDFDLTSYGFARIVQRTSAALRYDKYNTLRLKYNDSVNVSSPSDQSDSQPSDSRMDHVWIDFPRLRAICDSGQYYAMYVIVQDLFLWHEPLEKNRSERLEKIMLASDFSDLRGTPEMVIRLQERIRQLEEIKTHFHVNEKYLDRQGWADRITMEQDLSNCEDELFFMMKAITTSQRKPDERGDAQQVSGVIRYYVAATEIVWHLIKEAHQPMAEFQLGHATFERTDNSDGSNQCVVEIDRIYGINLLSSALYPEIIAAYLDAGQKTKQSGFKMLRVNWQQLEAIAGINVVDRFEVNLFPVKLQLEYDTGRQLFEYIFPDTKSKDDDTSPFTLKTQAPDEEEEEDTLQDAETARHASIAKLAKAPGVSTGAGSLEMRLQPTFKLPEAGRPVSAISLKTKRDGLGIDVSENKRFGFLRAASSSNISLVPSQKSVKTKTSQESMRTNTTPAGRSSMQSLEVPAEQHKTRRFGLGRRQRSRSADSKQPRKKDAGKSANTDDLTQMLNRASNYMTLAYFKVPSVVLCLTYKGKGDRNFEDVHNLVFRMPTLEWRNKTWSNLDLALALKKEVIRALISHTGAIVRNKLSHHSKPGKAQLSRLRDLVSSSVVLSSTDVSRNVSPASPGSSVHALSIDPSESPVAMSRTDSYSSDLSNVVGIEEEREGAERAETDRMNRLREQLPDEDVSILQTKTDTY